MKKSFLKGVILLILTFIWSNLAVAAEYSLGELYGQALRNSEKIKMAEENIYIAQMGKNKALSLLIPRLTATAGYSRYTEQKYSAAGVLIQPNEAGTWTVRADQTFTLNARELDALKVAGQTITKTEYDLDTAKSDYLLAVAASYYDVLKAKKSLEIAAANMARLSQYRNSVETRVKVGEQTKTALLRAEGELSGARAEYVKATNAMQLTRATLVRVTGVEDNFRLKEEKNPLSDDYELKELRKTALEFRTDLKSYDMQMQMAAQQVKYARGAFWPNIGLFAVYNGADQNPITASLNRESIYGGVSLAFPFFEGGLRVAELKEARAKERRARLMYEDAKRNVDVVLQDAYQELETLKGSLRYLSDQLAFAQDNYDSVLRQYENGLATSLDVMDANNLLLSSEKNYADALYGYQLAQLKIKKSSGTLIQ
ncbi:MAG TPA: TolC family protein, partial [Smithellaceae bacterium]|nr:TolC family protein [Smithellaceae bacterium]